MLDRQEYLLRLEAELGKTLSSEEVDLLVVEARSHLEESIQARLELGASPHEAERQALAAFGEAHRVREEIQRRDPWIDRRFLYAALGLVAAIWSNSFLPGVLLLPLLVGLYVAYVVASMNARRPQIAALLVVLPTFLVGLAAIDARQMLTLPLNGQSYHRSRIPREIAELRQRAEWSDAQPAVLARGLASYQAGETDLAPNPRPTYSGDRLRLRKPASRAEGLRRWREAHDFMAQSMPALAESQRNGADALERAAALPWPAGIPSRLLWLLKGPGMTETLGAFVAVHLLTWGIGALLRRFPRYRRGAHV